MGIKLSTSEFRAAVSSQFNDQSLAETAMKFADATEALCAHLEDGSELCHVVDNLTLVANALANGGLTKQFLATFNGEGETSAAAGCEALTVAGLEALGQDQVAALEAKYATGLGAKVKEYWAKFITWLKNLWAKFADWFQNLFVNRAKYVAAVEDFLKNTTAEGWNPDGKLAAADVAFVAGIKTDKASKFNQALSRLSTAIDEVVAGKNVDVSALEKDLELVGDFDSFSKKQGEVKVGDLATWKGHAKAYVTLAKDKSMSKIHEKIKKLIDNLVQEAGDAAKTATDGGAPAKERVAKKRESLLFALKCIRNANRQVQHMGKVIVAGINAGGQKKESK